MDKDPALVASFWDRTLRLYPEYCWTWLGAITKGGYGQIFIPKQKNQYVHRFSYEMHYGPIPEGALVMHSCDNRVCVNPHHLSVGSCGENIRDMCKKGRHHMTVKRLKRESICQILS